MKIDYLDILTISQEINKINERFNAWTDKFTSNGVVASFLTLGLFLIICIAVSRFASK